MPRDAIGLDIGGANIKAATATGKAVSVPFELWRHPDRLSAELVHVREHWPDIADVAVTMTGELCDCFSTKRDGVRHILAAVETAFPGRTIGAWSTQGRFLSPADANREYLSVAAANWHALATFVGRGLASGPAILLDTGSTTTDIIPILDRLPIPLGKTDPERIRSGELVYTGVRRTPVCAVVGPAVAAEWFATTADVYVVLGLLPEVPGDRATADGRPLTVEFAHARLARMLGGDSETTSPEETRALAQQVYAAQRRGIVAGIRKVVDRLPERPVARIVSGSGEFLARAAWSDAISDGLVDRTGAHSVGERLGHGLSAGACAYAVAVLATERPA